MNTTSKQPMLTSMIEKRIRQGAEPVARADASALEAVIENELAKIGVGRHRTSLSSFIDEVQAHRLSSLIEARTAAVAERMVASSEPTSATDVAAACAYLDAKLSEFLGDAPAPAAVPEPAVVGEMVVKLDIDTSSIDALSARLDEMRQKLCTAVEGIIAIFAKAGIVAPTVQSAKIEQGDALVVTMPGILSREQADQLRGYIRAELGHNVRVLIMDRGASLAVLSGLATAGDGVTGD